jgi:hypothetical protein
MHDRERSRDRETRPQAEIDPVLQSVALGDDGKSQQMFVFLSPLMVPRNRVNRHTAFRHGMKGYVSEGGSTTSLTYDTKMACWMKEDRDGGGRRYYE